MIEATVRKQGGSLIPALPKAYVEQTRPAPGTGCPRSALGKAAPTNGRLGVDVCARRAKPVGRAPRHIIEQVAEVLISVVEV
jgi:hypothetical protein